MTITANLDALLAQAVSAGELPNVVAIVGNREGRIYEGAFGPHTLGEPAAVTPQSVIWIASMSKAITAAAAMQLVEQGRLELDAPAQNVLPALGQMQVLSGFDLTRCQQPTKYGGHSFRSKITTGCCAETCFKLMRVGPKLLRRVEAALQWDKAERL